MSTSRDKCIYWHSFFVKDVFDKVRARSGQGPGKKQGWGSQGWDKAGASPEQAGLAVARALI